MDGLVRVRKRTVEESWSISVHDLLRGGWLDTSFEQPGQIVWRRGGREVSSVVFWSCRDYVRLRYRTDEGLEDYVVRIVWRPMAHRGVQPFFSCPGHSESRTQERDLDLQAEYLADFPRELAPGCGKLQVRLYLVPEGERFACRTCGQLTYASSQDVRPRPWLNGFLVKVAHSGVRQSYERVCSEGDRTSPSPRAHGGGQTPQALETRWSQPRGWGQT